MEERIDKTEDENYGLLTYLDDLESALMLAQKNGLSQGLIKGIESIHDDMVELSPLLKSEADYRRLKADVEEILSDLYENCRKAEENFALGCIRQLRDKLRHLKFFLEHRKPS